MVYLRERKKDFWPGETRLGIVLNKMRQICAVYDSTATVGILKRLNRHSCIGLKGDLFPINQAVDDKKSE